MSSGLVFVIAALCWQNAARILSLPSVTTSQILPDSFRNRSVLRQELAWTPPYQAKRVKFVARIPGVYPYSVVPGGIKDSNALREAVARDKSLARHYAHFDFHRARLIRLAEDREVYVSYRIRDTIFWTKKKVRLHKGEMLLTDGKIAARAHCGNQVSDTAKPEVSEEEPEEDVLDEPVAVDPLGPSMPVRPVLAPADLPSGQPIAPKLFAGGFYFPYISPAVPAVPEPCRFNNGQLDRHCHPHRHKHPKLPEPASMLLLTTGLAILLWRYRSVYRPANA